MIEGRKKIFVFGGISLLFIIAMILLFLFLRDPAGPSTETPVATTTPNGTEVPIQQNIVEPLTNTPPPPPATTEERERIYVKQLARTFVERFETYSNQNDNRNIEDATELATANMASYIATKSQQEGSAYQGVTTKVISMDVVSFSGTSASVKIGAQVESQTQSASNTSYKNGRVELLKVDGVWKVNGLFWDAS